MSESFSISGVHFNKRTFYATLTVSSLGAILCFLSDEVTQSPYEAVIWFVGFALIGIATHIARNAGLVFMATFGGIVGVILWYALQNEQSGPQFAIPWYVDLACAIVSSCMFTLVMAGQKKRCPDDIESALSVQRTCKQCGRPFTLKEHSRAEQSRFRKVYPAEPLWVTLFRSNCPKCYEKATASLEAQILEFLDDEQNRGSR